MFSWNSVLIHTKMQTNTNFNSHLYYAVALKKKKKISTAKKPTQQQWLNRFKEDCVVTASIQKEDHYYIKVKVLKQCS